VEAVHIQLGVESLVVDVVVGVPGFDGAVVSDGVDVFVTVIVAVFVTVIVAVFATGFVAVFVAGFVAVFVAVFVAALVAVLM